MSLFMSFFRDLSPARVEINKQEEVGGGGVCWGIRNHLSSLPNTMTLDVHIYFVPMLMLS
jgi:hypothetical protein